MEYAEVSFIIKTPYFSLSFSNHEVCCGCSPAVFSQRGYCFLALSFPRAFRFFMYLTFNSQLMLLGLLIRLEPLGTYPKQGGMFFCYARRAFTKANSQPLSYLLPFPSKTPVYHLILRSPLHLPPQTYLYQKARKRWSGSKRRNNILTSFGGDSLRQPHAHLYTEQYTLKSVRQQEFIKCSLCAWLCAKGHKERQKTWFLPSRSLPSNGHLPRVSL